MQNIKKILDSLLESNNTQQAWKMNLIKNWPTIIGSLHERVSLHKINKTTIVLGVYDSSWMQELYLLSKLILKKINYSLDQPRIESLRFQCIEKKEKINQFQKKQILDKKAVILSPLQSAALQKIKDPQLSQALEGLLQKCQQ